MGTFNIFGNIGNLCGAAASSPSSSVLMNLNHGGAENSHGITAEMVVDEVVAAAQSENNNNNNNQYYHPHHHHHHFHHHNHFLHENGGGGAGNNGGVVAVNSGDNNGGYRIKDVWADNLWTELKTVRVLARQYNFIAMDTEFPGIVAKPVGKFPNSAEYMYKLLKCNVDMLRIIQLGLTLFDGDGNLPDGPYTTWQFNFKFDVEEDMHAEDSIELLTNSKIQFQMHKQHGIDPFEFSVLLTSSGLVLNDRVNWLAFHSNFDFGYLMRMLMNAYLPSDEEEFFEYLRIYFPRVYDVKYLLKNCKNLRGGLQEIADQLNLTRIGLQHQAGSDSLLTGMAFFKIKQLYFENQIDDDEYCGQLYGLGLTLTGGLANDRGIEIGEDNSQ